MASPLQRQVLIPKKPILVYRLEQKITIQDLRIKHLEDALELASIENVKLKTLVESGDRERTNSIKSQCSSEEQFSLSL